MSLLDIVFTQEEKQKGFEKMLNYFLKAGKEGITMSHYDFHQKFSKFEPALTLENWKAFLTDGRIAQYVNDEFEAIKNVELRKIITDIADSKSVGQAQIVNALAKLTEGVDEKTGPAFIYTYVPPTVEQRHADNIVILDSDPFLKEE